MEIPKIEKIIDNLQGMKEIREEDIYRTFPNLYRRVFDPYSYNPTFKRILCDKGWYKLVYVISDMISKIDPNAELEDVIEKDGLLKIYCLSDKKEVSEIVKMAELISGMICVECGGVGERRKYALTLRTFCDKCYKNS